MMLTADDRDQIRDLLLTYTDVPNRTEEKLINVFTDDVLLEGPRGFWEGTEGVRGFWDQFNRSEIRQPSERGPLVTNYRFVDRGDEVDMTAAYLMIKGEPGEERNLVTGWYECVARKVGGKWKLAKRITHVDGVPLFRTTAAYKEGKQWTFRKGSWELEAAQ